MISYFSELRYKEVIDIHTGRRLGYVCDAEFDEAEGRKSSEGVLDWRLRKTSLLLLMGHSFINR